ncbi:hypothetical protein K2173_016294 [Erythroxylum novogranatense]|uniref:FLZ-type domain-containing protein n=1 Tax=Erythroxylum novogranatense TaxID=1862640 RepID=A0AAV8SGI9_9ROSI|nr:hypothetical protein K2173_016294 [Erythroxylum novogranatense]
MLGKRTHPMIVRLSELLASGSRAGSLDVATSPRSPLDFKIQSPRGLKSYDVGGVGLGIVAALEKSGNDSEHEILAKYAIRSPGSNRSGPVSVGSGKNCERIKDGFAELETDSLEDDYTFVTIHGPNESYTKVYYDGDDHRKSENKETVIDISCDVASLPQRSPARVDDDVSFYPTSDFLSSCNLCRKKLHGKDIYMYRGEEAFCSPECRSRQIMKDERKEQCRSRLKTSADVPSSSCTASPIFSPGILAI